MGRPGQGTKCPTLLTARACPLTAYILSQRREAWQGFRIWCCRTGLNCRPLPYQGSALPLSYGSEPIRRRRPYCHMAAAASSETPAGNRSTFGRHDHGSARRRKGGGAEGPRAAARRGASRQPPPSQGRRADRRRIGAKPTVRALRRSPFHGRIGRFPPFHVPCTGRKAALDGPGTLSRRPIAPRAG